MCTCLDFWFHVPFIAVRQVMRKKYSRARQTELTFFQILWSFLFVWLSQCIFCSPVWYFWQQGDDSHRLLWWGKKYNLYDLLHLQWAFSFTFLMFLWSNLAFRNYAMLNISYILFFLIMIPLQQSRTNYCRLTIGFENFRQRFKSKGEVLRMLCCVGVHRQLKSLSNNAI